MITVWFSRNRRYKDSLLAARDAINQAIFERAAKSVSIRLVEDEDEDILDIGTEGATNPQVAEFLRELASVGLSTSPLISRPKKNAAFSTTLKRRSTSSCPA